MQNTDRQRLKRQLEQQAQQLIDLCDRDLLMSLLSTCNALMRMAENIMCKGKNEKIPDEVYANYLSLTKSIKQFYEIYVNSDISDNERTNKELLILLTNVQDKEDEVAALKDQYKEAIAANEELQKQLENYKKEIKEQATVEESLNKMLQEYSLEKIDMQKQKNEDLLSTLTSKKGKLKELTEQHVKLKEEKRIVQERINKTDAEIRSIPIELVQLRDRYKELEQLLSELRDASVKYNVEKQRELQKDIDKLTPIVEKNKVTTEILTNRKESIEHQNTEYDKSRQILTTDLIEIINSSLNELRDVLQEHEEFLKETENRADTLAKNLAGCRQKREEYSHWFDSVETPLEAMIKGIQYPENENLRENLDVNQLPSIRNRLEQTHQNLMELDEILIKCAAAAQKDLQRIQKFVVQ